MKTLAEEIRKVAYKIKEEQGIIRNIKDTWDKWMDPRYYEKDPDKKDKPLIERIKGFVGVAKGQLKNWFMGSADERMALLRAVPQATDKMLKVIWKEDDLKVTPDPRHPEIRVLPFEQKKLEFEIV